MDYCNRTFALEELHRYEHGVALAVFRQTNSAIADFIWFEAYSQERDEWDDVRLVTGCIDKLKQGENTFIDQDLKSC